MKLIHQNGVCSNRLLHILLACLTKVSIGSNSVDLDQADPIGSGSKLFAKKVSKTFQQATKADDFCCV